MFDYLFLRLLTRTGGYVSEMSTEKAWQPEFGFQIHTERSEVTKSPCNSHTGMRRRQVDP